MPGMPRPAHRRRLAALLVLVATLTGLAGTAVSAADALPACRVADTLTPYRELTDWRRTLVDLTYRVTSGYKPTDLRSTADAGLNGGYSVRAILLDDLRAMAAAARAADARFSVQSAYRSYATQVSTFDYWVSVYGYSKALTLSARPGHSEHQLGTAIDFRSYGGGAPWDHDDWATTRAGAWLKANAWRYGFIMSYPKGKSTVTCYAYEPWHYRYLGRERAAKLHESGLTIREALWMEMSRRR